MSEFSGGSALLPLTDYRQPLQRQPKKPKKTQLKGEGKGKKKGGGKGNKKILTGMSFKGKEVCKKFNDQRGCSRSCPDNRLHSCDALNQQGQVCGSTSHSRKNHPNPRFE